MGYAKILWIYEDGIQDADRSPEGWSRLRPEVGEAVLKVCLDQSRDAEGQRIHSSHAVGPHSNCVNYVDEVHSTHERLYLWVANCLRPLEQLDEDELSAAERALRKERERRAK